MAEVMVPRDLFRQIVDAIAALRSLSLVQCWAPSPWLEWSAAGSRRVSRWMPFGPVCPPMPPPSTGRQGSGGLPIDQRSQNAWNGLYTAFEMGG